MTYLISENDIINIRGTSANIEPRRMLTAIAEAQKIHIKAALGEELYLEVSEEVEFNSLTAANKNLLPYIQDALAYHAYARYIIESNYQNTATGFKKKISDHSENASAQEISMLYKTALQDAEHFTGIMINFLHDNRADYPLWKNHCNGDTTANKSWGIF